VAPDAAAVAGRGSARSCGGQYGYPLWRLVVDRGGALLRARMACRDGAPAAPMALGNRATARPRGIIAPAVRPAAADFKSVLELRDKPVSRSCRGAESRIPANSCASGRRQPDGGDRAIDRFAEMLRRGSRSKASSPRTTSPPRYRGWSGECRVTVEGQPVSIAGEAGVYAVLATEPPDQLIEAPRLTTHDP